MRNPPELAVAAMEEEVSPLASPQDPMKRLALLSIGHYFIDLYSSALGALQPLLVARYGLSLFQAGTLGGLLSFSSSMMQPLYGYLSDRLHFRGFTVLAPAVAAVFISSLGLAPGYGTLLALVLLGGVGVAAFHPQGTAHASTTFPYRRGLAMATFITSGTIGLASGPAFFSWVAGRFGLERTYWAAAPGIGMTLVLAALLPAPPRTHHTEHRFDWAPFRPVWKPMVLLYFLVVIRSVVQITFTQFLALYFHLDRGFSVRSASYVLSLFLVAGALGGFAGGNLADRFGGRRIVMISMIGSVPFLSSFLLTRGALSLAGLFAGGLILFFTIPVNVTMAQELVPTQAGTVSALMMGFAWGMAGLAVIPAFGWSADHLGLHRSLWGVVLLPLAGFILAWLLPPDHLAARHRPRRAGA